jgi:hypothetical protein
MLSLWSRSTRKLESKTKAVTAVLIRTLRADVVPSGFRRVPCLWSQITFSAFS